MIDILVIAAVVLFGFRIGAHVYYKARYGFKPSVVRKLSWPARRLLESNQCLPEDVRFNTKRLLHTIRNLDESYGGRNAVNDAFTVFDYNDKSFKWKTRDPDYDSYYAIRGALRDLESEYKETQKEMRRYAAQGFLDEVGSIVQELKDTRQTWAQVRKEMNDLSR